MEKFTKIVFLFCILCLLYLLFYKSYKMDARKNEIVPPVYPPHNQQHIRFDIGGTPQKCEDGTTRMCGNIVVCRSHEEEWIEECISIKHKTIPKKHNEHNSLRFCLQPCSGDCRSYIDDEMCDCEGEYKPPQLTEKEINDFLLYIEKGIPYNVSCENFSIVDIPEQLKDLFNIVNISESEQLWTLKK